MDRSVRVSDRLSVRRIRQLRRELNPSTFFSDFFSFSRIFRIFLNFQLLRVVVSWFLKGTGRDISDFQYGCHCDVNENHGQLLHGKPVDQIDIGSRVNKLLLYIFSQFNNCANFYKHSGRWPRLTTVVSASRVTCNESKGPGIESHPLQSFLIGNITLSSLSTACRVLPLSPVRIWSRVVRTRRMRRNFGPNFGLQNSNTEKFLK